METLAELRGKHSCLKQTQLIIEVQSVFFFSDFRLFPQITRLGLITLDAFDVTSLRQRQWNLLLRDTSLGQWKSAASVEAAN